MGGIRFTGYIPTFVTETVTVEAPTHPVMKNLGSHFASRMRSGTLPPALAASLRISRKRMDSWIPSPRANKNVKVLLALDASNFPLGFKDTLTSGDIPVVWTNTTYRMVYLNMGHRDRIFADAHQNDLFEDALRWLGERR